MRHAHKNLAEQVLRLTNKLIFLEKKSMLSHGNIKLYPSEIHLLDVVDQARGINASEMAARLGITKGAVSQTLTRLENKGVIHKTKAPNHKNELTVHFTKLGDELFEQYRNKRASLAKRFAGYLSEISDEDRNVIQNFLGKLEGFFDDLN
jgi:DNA-binding MarR family transcriptional regulator